MFGLENQKKKKEEFVFELEKELQNPKFRQDMKKKIEGRVQEIKDVLRSGESKEEFDMFGSLLHAYTSLLKVLGRFTPKA